MNILDMRTVFLTGCLVTGIICVLIIGGVWLQNRKRFPGLAFWLAVFAFPTAAFLMVGLRGAISDWISVVLANTLMIAGALLGYVGLERFVDKRGPQAHNYILLAVFPFIHSYFFFIHPNLTARSLNFSIVLLILCFQCMWLMLRRVDAEIRPLTRWTGWVFGAYCLVLGFRIVLLVISVNPKSDYLRSGTAEISIAAVLQMLLILLAFSMAMMVNRRLLMEIQTQEELFSKAFHSSPYAMVLTRLSDGNVIEVNEGFEDVTGYPHGEVPGKTIFDLHFWADDDDRVSMVRELLRNDKIQGKEAQFKKKSGEIFTGLCSADVITVNNEKCILASIEDITRRKLAEEALRTSEERLRSITASARDAIVMMDSRGCITYWNPAAEEILGYRPEEAIGKNLHDLLAPGRYQAAHLAAFPEFRRTGRGEAVGTTLDLFAKRKDGREVAVALSLSAVLQYGEWHAVGIIRDITERLQAEEKIRHMANHDALTDLPTLRLANDRLYMALNDARRNRTKVAVMFMDLDGFKSVNDSLGHEAGDDVLKQVARRLLSCVREVDTVARVGGDEFLVVASGIRAPENAAQIAEKLVSLIAQPIPLNGKQAVVGASVGIALFPDDGEDSDQLVKLADEAMYVVKKSGKNGYGFAHSAK